MSILVSEIFQRTGQLLQDAGATRWTDAIMLDWYNEGLLDMVTRKGALLPIVETFTCAAGSQQAVPANRIAIIAPGRNLGPTAAPRNGAVPIVFNKEQMDRLHPTWQNDSAKSVVTALIGSPYTPRLFYVYPPQSATAPGRLEMTFSKYPSVVSDTSSALELQDEHEPIVIEYLLYRAMGQDGENPQLLALSNQHQQNYLGMLGVGAPVQQQG